MLTKINLRIYHRIWMSFFTLVFAACASTQPTLVDTPIEDTVAVNNEPSVSLIPPAEPVVDPGPYRAENTRLHDLIHTKLEVRFDWNKQHLLGTATLELRPYFYPQSVLILDAKGFDIHAVSLIAGVTKNPLNYQYDQKKLSITLDRIYHRDENYFVEIEYTSKPNELEIGGSVAITADKGLYFINPLGEEENKPQQIWTQGETESSSCWFPTIDSPNQRTTQEIYITVKDRFTTLSNGQLIYSKGNNDGTRTDYWKLDMAHAPYLFMMAIGEFAVVKDQWEGKEVAYYVEPKFEPYAKSIFGRTPQMMTYFSQLLEYPYPWPKYSQVVVRDYVSGAMENTTASVFMEDLQVDDRYLIDDDWDGIIAHELLHHWFGDLVTSESWSNLTLNEAFATYAEYLWAEHRFGTDEADYLGYQEQQNYLEEAKRKKVDLVRFYYQDKEDMFDSHSYAKGSRILHMLRKHLGDDAFFKTLNKYLTTYSDQPVEIHHLRLMAESVSGQDLNWFFNQWFLDSGHPDLEIEKQFANDTLTLSITQNHDLDSAPIYRLPISIEIWQGQQSSTHQIVLDQMKQNFSFPISSEPELVSIDKENQLLATLSYNQPKKELIHQYHVGTSAVTRLKTLEKLLKDSVDQQMVDVFIEALKDPYWAIRQLAVNVFEGFPGSQNDQLISLLNEIAEGDSKSLVRADAITTLSSFPNEELYLPLYLTALEDSSYAVAGAGLSAYLQLDHHQRDDVAGRFENEHNMQLVIPLADYYALEHVSDKYNWYRQQLSQANGELLYYLLNYLGQYLTESASEEQIEGAKYLEDVATNHDTYYIRFSAFQALSLLDGVAGVTEMRQRVKESEKDPRLVEVYQQIQ